MASPSPTLTSTFAFVPFPTGLIGSYENEPVAFVLYAITLAVASLLEGLMFLWSAHTDLQVEPLPRGTLPWAMAAQLLPVMVFLGSIPIALHRSTTAALLSWPFVYVLEALLDRVEPEPVRAFGDYRRRP